MQENSIHAINSVPIYHAKIKAEEFGTELSAVESFEFKKIIAPTYHWEHSDNFDVLSLSVLSDLKKIAEHHINWYQTNVCGIHDQNLYITRSWISRTVPGSSTPAHCHENSVVSGVIYLSVEPGAVLCFRNSVELFRNFKFNFTGSTVTEFTKTNIEVPIAVGDVLLWPSWIDHWSNKNISDQNRLCVAFDTFVRGQFGDIDVYGNRVGLNRLNLS